MRTYCERRTDIKSGWEQPKLPYHGQKDASANLSGNALENEEWDGVIRDYQTACPKLILTCPGYFDGAGVGTICIPIKYCPECGRKLGQSRNTTDFMDEHLDDSNQEGYRVRGIQKGAATSYAVDYADMTAAMEEVLKVIDAYPCIQLYDYSKREYSYFCKDENGMLAKYKTMEECLQNS